MTNELIYLLNGAFYLAVFVICIWTFIFVAKKKNCCLGNYIGIMGFCYLLMAALNIAWFVSSLKPSVTDFMIIKAVLISFKAVILSVIIHKVTNNKHIIILIGILFAALFSVFLFYQNVVSLALVAYILVFILFMEISFTKIPFLRRAGYAGMAYAVVSLVFTSFAMLGRDPAKMPWFVALVFAGISFYYFMQYCKSCREHLNIIRTEIPMPLNYIRLSLFAAMFGAFIFLSTAIIHEFGHAFSAWLYGCGYEAIIFKAGLMPQISILPCSNINPHVAAIGGLAITTIIAFLFYFTGGKFSAHVSYLIFGFGALIANADLALIGISGNIVFMVNFFGVVIVLLAIVRLAYMYSCESFRDKVVYCHENKE